MKTKTARTNSKNDLDVSELYTTLGNLCARIENMENLQERNDAWMRTELQGMGKAIAEIQANANRLKGAFIMTLLIGSLLGWLASQWEKLRQFFN